MPGLNIKELWIKLSYIRKLTNLEVDMRITNMLCATYLKQIR